MGVKYIAKNDSVSFKKILTEGTDPYMNIFCDTLYLTFFGFPTLTKIGAY